MSQKKTILITGVAGFIGYHLCKRLINSKYKIIGLDNMNTYYEPRLKDERLKDLKKTLKKESENFIFINCDLEDEIKLEKIFREFNPKIIVNLAAQAGVRYSIENPKSYINSNILGFSNLIQCARKHKIENYIYASSSSVYGGNTKLPFSENDEVSHPVSLYAATKKSNELIAHSYSHLYQIPTTGLRLFTVYGPWGRPDMAPMIFTKSILEKKPIKIFNNGNMSRDFTFIDDVIEIIERLINKPALSNANFKRNSPDSSTSWSPYRIFNIGNNKSCKLMEFINLLEKELNTKAIKEYVPMQNGDVQDTYADTEAIENWIGYKPDTSLEKGIKLFVDWYKNFYNYF